MDSSHGLSSRPMTPDSIGGVTKTQPQQNIEKAEKAESSLLNTAIGLIRNLNVNITKNNNNVESKPSKVAVALKTDLSQVPSKAANLSFTQQVKAALKPLSKVPEQIQQGLKKTENISSKSTSSSISNAGTNKAEVGGSVQPKQTEKMEKTPQTWGEDVHKSLDDVLKSIKNNPTLTVKEKIVLLEKNVKIFDNFLLDTRIGTSAKEAPADMKKTGIATEGSKLLNSAKEKMINNMEIDPEVLFDTSDYKNNKSIFYDSEELNINNLYHDSYLPALKELKDSLTSSPEVKTSPSEMKPSENVSNSGIGSETKIDGKPDKASVNSNDLLKKLEKAIDSLDDSKTKLRVKDDDFSSKQRSSFSEFSQRNVGGKNSQAALGKILRAIETLKKGDDPAVKENAGALLDKLLNNEWAAKTIQHDSTGKLLEQVIDLTFKEKFASLGELTTKLKEAEKSDDFSQGISINNKGEFVIMNKDEISQKDKDSLVKSSTALLKMALKNFDDPDGKATITDFALPFERLLKYSDLNKVENSKFEKQINGVILSFSVVAPNREGTALLNNIETRLPVVAEFLKLNPTKMRVEKKLEGNEQPKLDENGKKIIETYVKVYTPEEEKFAIDRSLTQIKDFIKISGTIIEEGSYIEGAIASDGTVHKGNKVIGDVLKLANQPKGVLSGVFIDVAKGKVSEFNAKIQENNLEKDPIKQAKITEHLNILKESSEKLDNAFFESYDAILKELS